MEIELKKNGKRVVLSDRVAEHLVRAGVARIPVETRQMSAEEQDTAPAPEPRRKRQYRRRDLKSED